ncbi:DHHA1 domain-containing protein [Alicyclobacillus sp. ALC3]|uniref:DHHA1 domain-containing protein n=1 Tax=Alicyclobacillus sp. ALC3 TaxID=2796143 RepID=UPI0023781C35|nr:DHHA1 domain-containing protein [Alicyclobacillus sp. ALC3]WDL95351.1 hypothetical protein JC200_13105 [Alicyclobacillus sp. ALC3]
MGLQAERLYYTNSYLREFSSVVEECQERDGETWVRLRESAFYPTSGGQPFDTGYLQVSGGRSNDSAGDHGGTARAAQADPDPQAQATPGDGDAMDVINVIAVEVENGHVWHHITTQRPPARQDPVAQVAGLADGHQNLVAGPAAAQAAAQQTQAVEAQTADCPLKVGQAVIGYIDWARRFDFMQQHSGQHILSACFEQMQGANTTSFHMGDTYCSIDLDVVSLSEEKLRDVMWEANRWIWRDVPIRARFVSQAELAQMQLRKAPSVTEDIRIVTIEGLEDNACGGTHPSSSGQVGQILVTKTERMRGGVRVTFACGERALSAGKEAVHLVRHIATDLSVGPADLAGAMESLQNQVKEGNRRYEEMRSRYASLLARDFAANQTKVIHGTHVLVAVLPILDDVQDVKRMALASAEWLSTGHPGAPQLVVFVGESGGRTHVVAQATDGAISSADSVIKAVLPALGGKGGGNATAAQGSAPTSASAVLAAIEAALPS